MQFKLRYIILGVFLISVGLSSCESSADKKRPDKITNDSITSETATENKIEIGIDKFNREEYESREDWQMPDIVIDLMGDLSDKTVAEIGAGTGYFTFRILPYAQKTIGIDINRRILNYLDSIRVNYLPEDMGEKLELRHVKRNDPQIADEEADIIFIANTFFYLPEKEKYLRKLKPALKEDGYLFIVDYKMHRVAVGPDKSRKIAQHEVEDYLLDAGFELLLSDDRILPYQYIIIAGK